MKVALIEPVGGHGGMNYYDMSLARALSRVGVAVTWYTCDITREVSEVEVEVIKCFKGVYGSASKWRRLWRFIVGLCYALGGCRIKGISIVHFHFFGMGPLELLMCASAKFFGRKICVTVHDVESFSASKQSVLFKFICRLIDQLVVHNESSLLALTEALPAAAVVQAPAIIPHGNYCEYVSRIDRDLARRELGLSENDVVILFFGQIKAVKGLDLLLAALPRIIESNSAVKLLIAGKVWKDNFSRYQEMIDKLSLGQFVESHIRYIPDEDVDLYYSASNVVALPYKKIYQSGVLLMAMSYGLPVIASNLRGMAEVISDGVDGYLFEAGDSAALAETLNKVIISDNEMLESNALNLMETKYSWSRVAEKTKLIYEGMI